MIERAILGVIYSGFDGLEWAVIPLGDARASAIALGAPDCASLAEPKAGLAAVAERICTVCALAVVRLDPVGFSRLVRVVPGRKLRVDGIPGRRHHETGVASDQSHGRCENKKLVRQHECFKVTETN